ncbi:Protein of unknown function [Corynebacterium mycetoides]|uniref:DUF1541 domain-containing protein n=1 Tax=Corynebacterium mycetoides TaxID=38302 RepID=A0A1G9PW44_9CORY|nr:YdhK family protein [Corynebacterium mycetoides]SDM02998.1 Protein of unknown function [Corynebacterium mycetoides]
MKTTLTALLATASIAALSACSPSEAPSTEPAPAHTEHTEHTEHAAHNHPEDGGPVPEGMAEAADPKYAIGSTVTLNTDHMPGMQGAPATIVGAYDTTTYEVSYTPTDGGAPVTHHKWVVQEEIKDAGNEPLADGSPIVIQANHMAGMDGAEGTVDSSTDETVYVVDYEADGMKMTNHKWVVESEIKPAS